MRFRRILGRLLLIMFFVLGLNMGSALAYSGSYVTATSGDTYLRSGPGLDYRRISVLKKGESAVYLEEAEYDDRDVLWYWVEADEEGWVSSRYTDLFEDEDWDDWDAFVETTASVNLRSGPGLSYDRVGTLSSGRQIDYLGDYEYDGRGVMWYLVDYRDDEAWISSVYSKLVGDEEVPNDEVGDFVDAEGNTNIRKSASLDGKIIGVFKKGSSAEYLGRSKTDDRGVVWYYVDADAGTGWVSSRYTVLY